MPTRESTTAREVGSLLARVQELERENRELKAKADLWDRFKRRLVGHSGEELTARWLVAERLFGNPDHDLVTPSKEKLEVKFSRLIPDKDTPKMFRWKWAALHGHAGRKVYDQLLLIGDANEEYAAEYKDRGAEYVIFHLTRLKALELAPRGHITLNSNPHPAGRSCMLRDQLFQHHQVTLQELIDRYGSPESASR